MTTARGSGKGTVIVGGGQAGYHTAWALRGLGYDRPIHLICEEPYVPYQRPPLSKTFLHDSSTAQSLWFASAEELNSQRILVEPGVRATRIDRAHRVVRLEAGQTLNYEHLVLATGARNRRLGVTGTPGVHYIRSIEDALGIRERLPDASHLIVVGAGFIGLEVASAAVESGREIDVVEASPQPMSRVLSPTMSQLLTARHDARGVRFHLGRKVVRIEGDASRTTVELDDGVRLEAPMVIICIGVVPETELAAAAGLELDDGIVVDERLVTADERIVAIGDCASFPSRFAGGRVRLESVQNAVDQAEHAAAFICGKEAAYEQVPWFWSQQGNIRLQIAGITKNHDSAVVSEPVPGAGGLSVLCFRGEKLIGVETINRPADHMAARRVLARGAGPRPDEARAARFDLTAWAKQHVANVHPSGVRATVVAQP